MKRFAAMLAFYTRFPIPKNMMSESIDFEKSLGYVPLVGLLIGVGMALCGFVTGNLSLALRAVLMFFLYLLMTGGLHMDGLADTMDAFGSNRSREKMLQIMKDSHIGTFGVLAILVYTLFMVALLPETPFPALLLFPVVGRIAGLLVATCHPYARDQGLGSSFVNAARPIHVLLGSLAVFLVVFLTDALQVRVWSALILLLSYLFSLLLVWLLLLGMSRKLGGVTGDLIGFSIEVSQILFLLLVHLGRQILV